jgi:hypothetical protein
MLSRKKNGDIEHSAAFARAAVRRGVASSEADAVQLAACALRLLDAQGAGVQLHCDARKECDERAKKKQNEQRGRGPLDPVPA